MPRSRKHPYQADMPYAKQPLKAIYVFQRLFTSIVMCVWWATYYSIIPRRHRQRNRFSRARAAFPPLPTGPETRPA